MQTKLYLEYEGGDRDLLAAIDDIENRPGAWNDEMFKLWVANRGVTDHGEISKAHIGPASMDLALDMYVRRPRWYWRNPFTRWLVWNLMSPKRRDMKNKENENFYWEKLACIDDEIVLWPGDFVIMNTVEAVRIPDDALGLVYVRSTPARMGLDHAKAGVIDPGFGSKNYGHGCTITLELVNQAPMPIVLEFKGSYVQLIMLGLTGKANDPYDGRYTDQGQMPVTPRVEKEFV